LLILITKANDYQPGNFALKSKKNVYQILTSMRNQITMTPKELGEYSVVWGLDEAKIGMEFAD